MATGDITNIAARIRRLLPGWFADTSPTANALAQGAATALAFIHGLYLYALAQTRILTATGIWLDLIAQDFFATALQRWPGQDDDSFRASIRAHLFRPRATRRGIADVLLTLTGNAPAIIEPFAPADTGIYGGGYSGYGAAGAYGSQAVPAQAFVTAFRPLQYGIAQVAGYGAVTAGYGVASEGEYASLGLVSSVVSDADIYAAIDATKPAGSSIWVRIANIWTANPLTRGAMSVTLNGDPLTLS